MVDLKKMCRNLLPWAKNTGCESQWFGGDGGGSDLVPWSASSPPHSTHTTGVMYPGTKWVWARHTQGALFLEVREGAKTAQSCNIKKKQQSGYATCVQNIHMVTIALRWLWNKKKERVILCQRRSCLSLAAKGTKTKQKQKNNTKQNKVKKKKMYAHC